MAMLFAATHADRTDGLVLYGSFPRLAIAPDWPGLTREQWDGETVSELGRFGDGLDLEQWAPSAPKDDQSWWATNERLGASPGAMRALREMNWEIDVRAVLPTISVPTLVLHRNGDRIVPVGAAHHLAAKIPDARLVVLDGDDHLPFYGDTEALVGEIQEFVTGSRSHSVVERVLATVVLTDIVGSTEAAARSGDAEWRRILDHHDACARRRADELRGSRDQEHWRRSARNLRRTGACGPVRRRPRTRPSPGRNRPPRRVHTGEIELRGDDIGGIAVHVGAGRRSLRARSRRDPGEPNGEGSHGRLGTRFLRSWHPPTEGRPGRLAALRGDGPVGALQQATASALGTERTVSSQRDAVHDPPVCRRSRGSRSASWRGCPRRPACRGSSDSAEELGWVMCSYNVRSRPSLCRRGRRLILTVNLGLTKRFLSPRLRVHAHDRVLDRRKVGELLAFPHVAAAFAHDSRVEGS